MFLSEFAQDLLYRLVGREYYFRAILTEGEFEHIEFENLEAFFGQALNNAYRDGGSLIGVGLFMDNRLQRYNTIFPIERHCEKYNYVFLTQDITRAAGYGGDAFPIAGELIDDCDQTNPTYAQLTFLADVYQKATGHPIPKVRAKFQATWNFYERAFPGLCRALRDSNFDFTAIANAKWGEAAAAFERELASEYYRFQPQ